MLLARLLLIDDSDAHRSHIRECLRPAALFEEIVEAGDGMEGLKKLLAEQIDVVLCDLEMPSFDGERLLRVKQQCVDCRELPFIFITASDDLDRRARLLQTGAIDVIAKPFHPPDLVARLRLHLRTKRLQDELRLKTETMSRLSTTDSVTGLRTRRYLTEMLAIEFLRTRRYGAPLTVLMADLDHFKNVNDSYGHLAGDMVLEGVSRLLLDQLRVTDVAGRFGGEEIMVILAHNDLEAGQVLAERWRMAVERADFVCSDGRVVKVQVSIGVASYEEAMDTPDDLLARVDEALYRAKDLGRNQVVLAEKR